AKFDPQPYPPTPDQQGSQTETPKAKPPPLQTNQNDASADEDEENTQYTFNFDEAFGDGEGLLIYRDGNVGIMVYVNANAKKWAARTSAAITDEFVPWPAPARLRVDEMGWWHLEAEGATHLSYIGGERMDGPSLTFTTPPRAAVAWDEYGRATRVNFDQNGIITAILPER
ncbi:MAG: hypothetical protein AAFV53_43050, partial [Myxococcota bacterium]